MLFLTNKCFITISIIFGCVVICSAQTDFGYPEDSHENVDKRNKDVSISTQLFFLTQKKIDSWDQMLSGSKHNFDFNFLLFNVDQNNIYYIFFFL